MERRDGETLWGAIGKTKCKQIFKKRFQLKINKTLVDCHSINIVWEILTSIKLVIDYIGIIYLKELQGNVKVKLYIFTCFQACSTKVKK